MTQNKNLRCEVCLSKATIFEHKLELCKSCDNLFNKWECENNQEARKELDRRQDRTFRILNQKNDPK